MTLGEFFDLLSQNPAIVLFYFMALPLTAGLAGLFAKEEANLPPWTYLYSALVYLAAIPGIFAVTLNVYLFLFERQSIFNANIYTQILPILSMALTFWLIRRSIRFDEIPGFDRLSGLLLIVGAVLTIMWICDRTHLIAITILPFYAVILMLLLLVVAIRMGLRKLR